MPETRDSIRRACLETLENRLMLARAMGCDISEFQGTMNWTTFKNAGAQYAFIRAGSSDFDPGADANGNRQDARFASNSANAKSNGVLYGVYWYGYPQSTMQTAVQQADYFLSIAQSRMTTGYLPPVLDLESGGGILSVTALSQWANDFCNRVFSVTGVRPIIYCNSNYARNYVNQTVAQWPLWIANWTTTTYGDPVNGSGSPPVGDADSGWPAGQWKFWQYSADGNGMGPTYGASSSAIDLDVYNGDVTALQSMVIGAPEITVAQGATNITDGVTTIDFGSVLQGQTGPTRMFTITNTGGQILNLSGLTVPGGYSIVEGLSAQLFAGQIDTFTVRLDSAALGTKNGSISFTTNDSNENPFNFPVTGTVSAVTVNAPSNPIASGITASGATVGWTDNSGNETQFLIERKTGAGGAWSQVGSSNANTSQWIDNTGLSSATQYYYRVRAFESSSGTYSGYTSDLPVLTLCAAPINVSASDGAFSSKIQIAWDAVAGAVSYQLSRGTTNNPLNASLLAPSSTTSFDDVGAVAGTTYYYWVAAKDGLNRLSAKSASDSGFRAIDGTPPQVGATDFVYQSAPQSVAFAFSEDVSASLDASYLSVTRDGSVDPVDVNSVVWDANTNTAYFELAGPLADDSYHAVLDGQFIGDAAGNPLGGTVPLDFFYLLGDANHDGAVDTVDFNLQASNFGMSGATWDQGDFNYDATIDSVDFNLLASQFGKIVSSSAPRTAVQSVAVAGSARPQSIFSGTRIEMKAIDDLLV